MQRDRKTSVMTTSGECGEARVLWKQTWKPNTIVILPPRKLVRTIETERGNITRIQ